MVARAGRVYAPDFVFWKAEYFYFAVWTALINLKLLRNFVSTRNGFQAGFDLPEALCMFLLRSD
jgi:hypothetical protein